MHILLINYEYPPVGGGAATAAYHLARALRRSGNDVTVLTSGYRNLTGVCREDGVRVVRCPALRRRRDHTRLSEMALFVVSAAARLPGLLADGAITGAIVFFALPCGPLGILGRLLGGVPYAVSLRGADVPGSEPSLDIWHAVLQPLRRAVLRGAVAVATPSRSLQRTVAARESISVACIPNGVDTSFLRPAAAKPAGRRVLYAGRLQSQKNLFFLLEQMDILFREFGRPFDLHLAGDGPLSAALKAYAGRLGIRDHVVWHGWCDRHALRRLYRQADCLVTTSLFEGLSNVILEAMACAVPVVASDVGGNAELVRHAKTGFLVDLNRPVSLRKAVRHLLEDRRRAEQMGRNARQVVEAQYSWDRAAAAFVDVLRRRRRLSPDAGGGAPKRPH